MLTIRINISSGTILMLLALLSVCQPLNAQKKPNMIVILTDDHGVGDMSFTGGTDISTPHLDKLFNSGMYFSGFYSNSTVCSPTRASLMTGRFPDLAGVPGLIRSSENNNWGYLREDLPLLPNMLKKAGYKTAIIGKWNLGLSSPNIPNDRGFDFFKGFLDDMMDDYYTHLRRGVNFMRHNKDSINPQGHATDIFADWAIEYIHDKKQSKEPFFLYLAFNAPHYPMQPPAEWLEKVKKRNPALSELRAKNIAMVEHMDDAIGRVMAALQTSGMADNTIIVYSSDNGGSLPHGASNGNLRGGKQDMYEGGIRVPACLVWPAGIKEGTENKSMTLTMDIFPTLCEIAGITIDHQIDGVSFLPTIQGKSISQEERNVFFMRREGGKFSGLCYYAHRSGKYKLIQNTPFEEMQLFDIEADPLEQHPLDKGTREYQKMVNSLTQYIRMSGAIKWQK
jgi:arylsulfatase A-like enzyme